MIVVIDDELEILDLYSEVLSGLSEFASFSDPLNAVRYIKSNMSDVSAIIVDQSMRPLTGSECIKILRILGFDKKIVMVSGIDCIEIHLDVMDFERDISCGSCGNREGKTSFLTKPIKPSELICELGLKKTLPVGHS